MNRRSLLRHALAAGAAFGVPALFAARPSHANDEALKLRELYEKDLGFSAYARAHEGREVSVIGYMAPPLKAEATFFVLTKIPMSVCPFCESEADWPSDILLVYTEDAFTAAPYNVPLVVTGTLELGTVTDPQLGFVSRVRLRGAEFERL